VDGEQSPTAAVAEAIAKAVGTVSTDLPPLYDTIDSEALDQLFERRTETTESPGKVLCFAVNGLNVFVRDDGRIRVCDPAGPPTPSPVFE
jgi:hypothetical protein